MGDGEGDCGNLYPPILASAFVSAFFPSLSDCTLVLYAFVIYTERNLSSCFDHVFDIILHFVELYGE